MFPVKEEYYRSIQEATYKKFTEEDKTTKKYINLSVGFYGGCSYHPSGWEACFASIRKNFPTEPIVLIEDGQPQGHDYSEMAKRYDATFIRRDHSIYLYWPTIQQTWEYLQWILQVADITKTEWLVQLHPDNICNDRYSIPPPGPICGVGAGSRTGVSSNKFTDKMNAYLLSLHPTIEMNGFGWAGGGCLHVPTFRKIMETCTYEFISHLHNEIDTTATMHEDLFLPYLFNLHGIPYRIWLEIEEVNRGVFGLGSSAAFQHGNKDYYNLTQEQIKKLGDDIQVQVRKEKLGVTYVPPQ
jgi:hypothetical protein